MKISEVAVALTDHYRSYKKANGGHKTAPEGKYGFVSIQYKVTEPDGTVHGPFLGRGSALVAFRNEVKLKGKPVAGVKFLVENIFKPKGETATVVRDVTTFEMTGGKAAKPVKTEQEKIVEALVKSKGVKVRAAEALGMSADVLRNRIKKYNIQVEARA